MDTHRLYYTVHVHIQYKWVRKALQCTYINEDKVDKLSILCIIKCLHMCRVGLVLYPSIHGSTDLQKRERRTGRVTGQTQINWTCRLQMLKWAVNAETRDMSSRESKRLSLVWPSHSDYNLVTRCVPTIRRTTPVILQTVNDWWSHWLDKVQWYWQQKTNSNFQFM